jgi:phosphoribosyl 1,2-cyclic phosphodiesterase
MTNKAELEFWGVRGTTPVSGPGFRKYGGHTLCASIRRPGVASLIIDAGTGIKNLGDRLMAEHGGGKLDITLLMTHFHLDHILGLPFFAPLFSPAASLTVIAPARPTETRRFLGSLMSGRLFPVTFIQTPCKKKIKELAGGEFNIGPYRIATLPLHHPQGSVAYRIRSEGLDVVLSTDTEHPENGVDKNLAAFVEGTDCLVYDATFTPEEYEERRKGWGHSTWEAGTALAEKAGARKLVLSHFSPDYRDKTVDKIVEAARSVFPAAEPGKESQ